MGLTGPPKCLPFLATQQPDCYGPLPQMDQPQPSPFGRKESILLIVLTAVLILSVRIPSHGIPSDQMRNADELTMLYSSMAPFLGVTATSQCWPGGGMRLLMLPTTFITYLTDCRLKPTPDGWVLFLAEYVGDWNRAVSQMRWISTVFVSLGFAMLVLPIRLFSGSALLAVIGATAATTVTAVWQRSVMGTPDGMALGLLAAALSVGLLSQQKPWRVVAAGALLGAAVATKISAGFVAPTVLLAVIFSEPAARWTLRLRNLLIFCAAGAVALLLVEPYFITDPLRSAKSILGNLLYRSAKGDLFDGIMTGASPWLMIMGLAGWIACLFTRQWGLFFASAVSIGLTAAIIVRSPQIDPHYFAPLVPLLAVLAFGTLPAALPGSWRAALAGSPRPLPAIVLVLLLGVAVFLGYRQDITLMRKTMSYAAASEWAARLANQLPPGTRAALPNDVDQFFRMPRSHQSVKRALDAQIEALYAGDRRIEFFRRNNLPVRLYAGLPANFTENEMMTIALYHLALQRSSDDAIDVVFWPVNGADDPNAPKIEQLISDFHGGKFDLLIVDQPIEGLSPAAEFTGGEPVTRRSAYRKAPASSAN